jgi:invasion protein IalB
MKPTLALCAIMTALLVASPNLGAISAASAQTEAPAKPKPVAKPKPKSTAKTNLTEAGAGDVTKYGAWTVTCPKVGDTSGARCFARMDVVDEKRKVVLISWLVGYNKEQKLLMDILTPTEVFIAQGLRLILDKSQPIQMPYISCGLNGCLSRMLLDKPTFALLQKAKFSTMSILGTNNKEVQMKIKSNGLAEAMAAISAPR